MRDDDVYRLVSVRRGHGGLFDRERLTGREILTKTLERLEPGAFILARMQIVHGACALVPEEMRGGAVSKSYVQFVGTPSCDIRFFARLAQTPEMTNLYLDASQGVVIEKMTFDLQRWLGFDINLPPLGEQQRIAEILDTVDDAIRNGEGIITKLKQVEQGLLHDLLTLGIDDNGEIRDADRHPEMFRDSALGRLPKQWKVCSFESLATETTLGTSKRGTIGRDHLHLIKMGNLGWDELDLHDVERVSRTHVREWKALLLRPGDLLFNTRNTPELVGKTAAWRGELADAVPDNNILRARFSDELNGVFAAHFMGNGRGRQMIGRLATGTTSVAAIYWRALRKLPLPVPPRPEQDEIVRRVDQVLARLQAEVASLAKLRLLKQGLMDDLLSGRVRVPSVLEGSNK